MDLNKVQLIGRLGKDPDSRFLPSGAAVTNLSVATSEKWTDKETGEVKERTEWNRCVAFGKTAEIANEYLRKGSQVYIEGSLRTNKWQDKEGNDRWTTEIVINNYGGLIMLGGGKGGGGARRQQDAYEDEDQDAGSSKQEDFDDDVPF